MLGLGGPRQRRRSWVDPRGGVWRAAAATSGACLHTPALTGAAAAGTATASAARTVAPWLVVVALSASRSTLCARAGRLRCRAPALHAGHPSLDIERWENNVSGLLRRTTDSSTQPGKLDEDHMNLATFKRIKELTVDDVTTRWMVYMGDWEFPVPDEIGAHIIDSMSNGLPPIENPYSEA